MVSRWTGEYQYTIEQVLDQGFVVLAPGGEVLAAGATDVPFSVQSISKVFSLVQAIGHSGESIWQRLGHGQPAPQALLQARPALLRALHAYPLAIELRHRTWSDAFAETLRDLEPQADFLALEPDIAVVAAYGLVAAVWTGNGGRQQRVARRVLGRCGSFSRMVLRIASMPEAISSLASNGVLPASSS